MLFLGILIAYLLFAVAVGKLLAYAAYQDEVWTDLRENVMRPVPVAAPPVRHATTPGEITNHAPVAESGRPGNARREREKRPV